MNHSRVRDTLSCVVHSTFYEKIILLYTKNSTVFVIIFRVVFVKPATPTKLRLRGALFRGCTAHNARSHLIKILSFHIVTFLRKHRKICMYHVDIVVSLRFFFGICLSVQFR